MAMPAGACSASSINKALARQGLTDGLGNVAQFSSNTPLNCADGWVAENPYQAGDAAVILRWREGQWRLVTSSSLSMCKSQLVAAGAPQRLVQQLSSPSYPILSPTCGTPEMQSPFADKQSSATSSEAATTSEACKLTSPNAPTLALSTSLSGLTCAEAKRVSATYWAKPVTMNNGNTNNQRFDGWECYAPTAVSSQEQNIAWTCPGNGKSFTVHNS